MKITQDVREYSEKIGADEALIQKGMEEKSKEFKESGAEVYL